MTGFFTPYCKSALRVLCLTLFLSQISLAQELAGIQGRRLDVSQNEEGWQATADFDITLAPALEEALLHGLTLPFVAEADLRRARWYWFDQRLSTPPWRIRLSYLPLTQQYRLGSAEGGLSLRFDRLSEALRALGRVRNWRLGTPELMQKGETYALSLRLQLDTTQLPKPFQLNAIINREWTLESPWLRMTVNP
jgi:hypothetical protein